MNENEIQKLLLTNRKMLEMNGVIKVNSFNETQIILSLSNTKLIIGGQSLKITEYNESSGIFKLTGVINNLKYDYKKQSILKRLFK